MNTRSCLTLLAAAALLATQPGASCVSDSSSGDSQASSSSSSGREQPDNGDRVPRYADIVREGKGTLEYTADADGTVWVQDVREETTIVSHRIHRGEKLRVVPEEDRVYLEGDRISKSDIKRDHSHRIYLDRDRRFENRDSRGREDWRNRDDRDSRDNGPIRGDVTKVPSGAELLDEGKGKNLAAWTKREGQIYVYDTDAKKVVATTKVKSGQRVVFAPNDDRVTVDGRRVIDRKFSGKTNYRLYQDR